MDDANIESQCPIIGSSSSAWSAGTSECWHNAFGPGRWSTDGSVRMVGHAKSADEVDLLVGQRVKRRRQLLGVSQGRLGGCLGLTFSQVQKYENGTNRIGAGRLHLLSMALDVPVQYFYQDLEEARAVATRNHQAATELAMLGEAFQSIKDDETRRSVLALVRSLAEP